MKRGINLVWAFGPSHTLAMPCELRSPNYGYSLYITHHGYGYAIHFKAWSTRCVVRFRGAPCANVSKRFVESDTYSLLWCVNLPLNRRTRCDEWTNGISTQIRHISHTHDARIMAHDASGIQTTHCVDLA